MRHLDPTSSANVDPERAEVLQIASTIDLDALNVDVVGGPPGSCGFRSGVWTADYLGNQYKFYASVPLGMELDAQIAQLQTDAAMYIAGVQISARSFE